jgi:aerobic carbon-monoxide dehydrogenase medium subunit
VAGGDVKPPDFRYLAPRTLEQALAALSDFGAEAKVLAGGQSLVPMMNLRLVFPVALVDLNYLSELAGVRETNGYITVGAMTRHREVATSALVQQRVPMLARAASMIGYPAIRNRGTIGGSLAHADPVAEMPCVAVTLDAELLTVGPDGERTIPASDFFCGYFTTALQPTEILTGVRIHTRETPERWSFMEFARKTGDFAVAAVGASAALDRGRLKRVRVGIAGALDRPVRALDLERSLTERTVADVRAAVADRLVRSTVAEEGQLGGWHPERSEIAGVLAERAIAQLLPTTPDGS